MRFCVVDEKNVNVCQSENEALALIRNGGGSLMTLSEKDLSEMLNKGFRIIEEFI